MRAKHTETMLRLTGEIKNIAKDLPPGKRHQIINRCNKINMAIKRQVIWTKSISRHTNT